MLNTIDEIVADILSKHKLEELQQLFNPSEALWEQRDLHVEFPRWIRNTYKLWNKTHPLTVAWHKNKRVIIDGIDCTKEHPDQVSAAIMRKLKRQICTTKPNI